MKLVKVVVVVLVGTAGLLLSCAAYVVELRLDVCEATKRFKSWLR